MISLFFCGKTAEYLTSRGAMHIGSLLGQRRLKKDRAPREVFSPTYTPPEKMLKFFCASGRKTLRGFFDRLKKRSLPAPFLRDALRHFPERVIQRAAGAVHRAAYAGLCAVLFRRARHADRRADGQPGAHSEPKCGFFHFTSHSHTHSICIAAGKIRRKNC